MIEALLKITDTKELKFNSKTHENFLLKLLDDLKNSPKEAANLLKSLNIKKEDLKEILSKNDIKEDDFKEVLNLLDKKIEKDTPKKITLSELLNQNSQEIVSQITLPSNQNSYKKTEIIKKQLISSFEKENIKLTNEELKEFKKIKSFKELVNFANKKGLNITKVKISKTKQQITISKQQNTDIKISQDLPKPKITFIKTDKTINKKSEKKSPIAQKLTLPNKEVKTKPQQIQTQHQKIQHEKPKSKIQEIITHQEAKTSTPKKTIFQEEVESFDIQKVSKETHKQTKKTENETPIVSQNNITTLKHDIIKAKQTIQKFSNDLNEAIKDYKPPVSKISIEMNPKDIGKVEVTLIHRGENLQIKINSNTQTTLNFIQTHQNELKQNLINMGYSEVNMSFNSNQQNQGGQHQRQKQHYSQTQEELEEIIIEVPYTYA